MAPSLSCLLSTCNARVDFPPMKRRPDTLVHPPKVKYLSARAVARMKKCSGRTPIAAVARGELEGHWQENECTGERVLCIAEAAAKAWTPNPQGFYPRK